MSSLLWKQHFSPIMHIASKKFLLAINLSNCEWHSGWRHTVCLRAEILMNSISANTNNSYNGPSIVFCNMRCQVSPTLFRYKVRCFFKCLQGFPELLDNLKLSPKMNRNHFKRGQPYFKNNFLLWDIFHTTKRWIKYTTFEMFWVPISNTPWPEIKHETIG